MTNIHFALRVLKGVTPEKMREVKVKPGFKYIGTHMIFDIKMDGNFTCKARLVAGGHNMSPTLYTTYSSVLTKESVRLEFLISGLDDLDIWTYDIVNAYLNDPCR